MASKTPSSFSVLFLALVGSVAILAGTMMAQSSSNTCSGVLLTLQPCLNYITGNSDSPTSSCCTKLGDVVKTQVQCLCLVVSGNATASVGKTINQTRALTLPVSCKVSTPSASLCNVSASAISPSGSPAATSGGPSSNGNLTRMTNPALSLVLLFVVTIMFMATLGNK